MKRIYTFTLKLKEFCGEEKFSDDLRLLAYMLYDVIYNSMGGNIPLNINKYIKYNVLNEYNKINTYGVLDEKNEGYFYRFDSDLYDDGVTYYEPFIVGDNTFCLTVMNNLIDIDTIISLWEDVLKMTLLNYDVDISFVDYESDSIDDERKRDEAIKKIYNFNGLGYIKKNSLIRRLFGCSRKRN